MERDARSPELEAILAKGLPATQAVLEEIRRRILALTSKRIDKLEFLKRARAILLRHEPILARTISDSLLAAWLAGGQSVAARLPEPSEVGVPSEGETAPPPAGAVSTQPIMPAIALPGAEPPWWGATPIAGQPPATEEPEPLVRFPIIEEAAKDLAGRRVLTRADFDQLASNARRNAFTVSRVGSVDTLQKIQGVLVEDVRTGGTLREFRKAMADGLDTSGLSDAHIENVYRTNVGSAYTRGLVEVLNHPLVSDAFPYLRYAAIHDSRTDPNHLAMETLGIQGTAIYRRDDPIWIKFLPPWRFQCRCSVIPITLHDAAHRYGILEAQQWLLTGIPPAVPAWVPAPPFNPPPGWTTHPRMEVLI